MGLLAPTLLGIPPVGLGIYSRSQPGIAGPWRFTVGHGAQDTWRFVGVDSMHAEGAPAAVRAATEAALTAGQSGIVVDPETPYTASQVDALASELRRSALRVRVGVTSFPSWGGIGRLIAALRGLAWFSPQLYYDARTNAAGWARWRRMLGPFPLAMIPSVAAYVSGPITTVPVAAQRATPDGYRDHIASVPHAGGVIAWPNFPVPDYMRDALASRWGNVGGLAVGIPYAAGSAVDSVPGLLLIAIMLAMLALTMLVRA